jgi:carbonic anhydrase/acetyltransferase-like protein (isoleucine patch superfamily)
VLTSLDDAMHYKPIISNNIRCRVPDAFVVGEGSIIDDFCYFSTQIYIGRFCHIANGVSIGGGKDSKFSLGDFSSISAGSKIWCSSDDFISDMAALAPQGTVIPKNTIKGDITISELTIVGSNTVVMPNNHIPIGTAIGALSFVPPQFEFEEWYVYAGIPIKPLKRRNRDEVLRQKDLLIQKLDEIRLLET